MKDEKSINVYYEKQADGTYKIKSLDEEKHMKIDRNTNIKRLTDTGVELFKKVKIALMKQYAERNDEDFPSDGGIIEKALESFYAKLIKKDA